MSTERYVNQIEDTIREMRALQHFLMVNPDLPVSYISHLRAGLEVPHPTVNGISLWDQVDTAELANIVRMMKADGGTVEKESSDDYMTYRRRLGHGKATVEIYVPRKAVCTPTVVRTETIVHKPVAGYTETRDVIEWDCHPLLAQAEENVVDAQV